MISQSLRSVCITLNDPSQVGETRRIAASIGRQLDFDLESAGKVGIISTEVATNLVRHAQQGQIILRPLFDNDARGIEILSLDRGPGMESVQKCLQDGYSSGGTAGTGLGSIQRLSSTFDIFSVPQKGTALVSRVWMKGAMPSAKIVIGAVCMPMNGEQACGDNWFFSANGNRQVIALADGLGHGVDAAHAANEAIRIFQEKNGHKLVDILQAAHAALRSTRGAAMSLAELNLDQASVRFSGIGNVAGAILDGPSSRSMVSLNGTLGSAVSRFNEFSYPWTKDSIMVLNSDGITTRWNVDNYPGLKMRHPSLIAGILYRDFQRERDDSTVVVIKERTDSLR